MSTEKLDLGMEKLGAELRGAAWPEVKALRDAVSTDGLIERLQTGMCLHDLEEIQALLVEAAAELSRLRADVKSWQEQAQIEHENSAKLQAFVTAQSIELSRHGK